MGQRHQIFVKAYNEERNEETTTVGFHHQWLYGATAIKQLRHMLSFDKNTNKYHKLSETKSNLLSNKDIQKIVEIAFSTNIEKGYYSTMISLNGSETEEAYLNPDNQDNNDGQTFVDFTGGKITYAYVFPFDREEDKEDNTTAITSWKVLSAREYIKEYYDLEAPENENEEEYFKTIKQDIEWIENNCELMSQEHFFELYPDLQN